MTKKRFHTGFRYYLTYPFYVIWWIVSGVFAIVVLWGWERIEKKGK